MQQGDAKSKIKQLYIGKKLRVTVKNDRVFEGKLMCVDYKFNLILHEAIATISPQHNCPYNYELDNLSDQKIQYKQPIGLTEQQIKAHRREFFGSHYYFGSIMIVGNDIKSIEINQDGQVPAAKPSQKIE